MSIVTGFPESGATGVELYHSADGAAQTNNFDADAEMTNRAGVAKYRGAQERLHALLLGRFTRH